MVSQRQAELDHHIASTLQRVIGKPHETLDDNAKKSSAAERSQQTTPPHASNPCPPPLPPALALGPGQASSQQHSNPCPSVPLQVQTARFAAHNGFCFATLLGRAAKHNTAQARNAARNKRKTKD